jgi:hypothetical protein
MNEAHTVNPDVYFHVRIVLGMVLGLSITRLLSGVAVYVQHPGRQPVSWLHLGWTLLMFLMVIHFWWFEFQLRGIERMTFPIYFFVLIYGSAWFILCALLYPSDIVEYDGYEDYFLSRRAWFFGIFAAMQGLDLVDTAIKGSAYFASLGWEYPVHNAVLAAAAIAAIAIRDRRFHLGFVAVAFLYEASWIWRLYDDLN